VTEYRKIQTTLRAGELAGQEADAALRTAASLNLGDGAHPAYSRYLRAREALRRRELADRADQLRAEARALSAEARAAYEDGRTAQGADVRASLAAADGRSARADAAEIEARRLGQETPEVVEVRAARAALCEAAGLALGSSVRQCCLALGIEPSAGINDCGKVREA
jgi:protein-disulfide isomerase-like protein with CxxC motif